MVDDFNKNEDGSDRDFDHDRHLQPTEQQLLLRSIQNNILAAALFGIVGLFFLSAFLGVIGIVFSIIAYMRLRNAAADLTGCEAEARRLRRWAIIVLVVCGATSIVSLYASYYLAAYLSDVMQLVDGSLSNTSGQPSTGNLTWG